jgi:hypothetical protein
VDAISLSGDARVKTLNIAAAPAAIELYFFLQAWFQAAPQAVFQTHLLFRQTSGYRSYQSSKPNSFTEILHIYFFTHTHTHTHTHIYMLFFLFIVTVQVLCIIMSIMILAIETASFQRFESQRINGRKLPWAMWLKKYCIEVYMV